MFKIGLSLISKIKIALTILDERGYTYAKMYTS